MMANRPPSRQIPRAQSITGQRKRELYDAERASAKKLDTDTLNKAAKRKRESGVVGKVTPEGRTR